MNADNSLVLVKYGGNAMKDEKVRDAVLDCIAGLHGKGIRVVLVHGGGPEINRLLEMGGVKSEFLDGQRKTTAEAMYFVQLALRGEVNGTLVRLLNHKNVPAVGLSGKDGGMVKAEKRYHQMESGGERENVDIGFVGNISSVKPNLIQSLLRDGYLPVIAPIAIGDDGYDYNINADIFAGKLAAALQAKAYISLTDVDGLYRDIKKPDSRIAHATMSELKRFIKEIAGGGMLPKLESIIHALENGVQEAHIFNGMKPHELEKQISGQSSAGTKIVP